MKNCKAAVSRYAKKWAKEASVDRRVLRDWEETVYKCTGPFNITNLVSSMSWVRIPPKQLFSFSMEKGDVQACCIQLPYLDFLYPTSIITRPRPSLRCFFYNKNISAPDSVQTQLYTPVSCVN